jgi:hypothetical protein
LYTSRFTFCWGRPARKRKSTLRRQLRSRRQKNQDPLNRETPQSAVVSFLEACHAESYAKAAKYFDLRNVASNQRLQEGPELAKQLALILDRDVQFDVASLSRNPEGTLNDGRSPGVERVDSFEVDGRKLDLELQRVTRRSGSQVWLFSAPSVALIPQIAHLTSDSPIERHLPAPLVNLTWMSMALWRWIALALAMVFVTAASRLVGRLILRVTEPLLHRIAPSADRRALDRFVGPLQMILAVAAFSRYRRRFSRAISRAVMPSSQAVGSPRPGS